MWFEADTDVTVPIDFIVDGDFVDPSSATFIIRDHTGAQLDSGPVIDGQVTVPAALNEILDPWENRYISVVFSYNGGTHFFRESYSLSEFIPLSARPRSVRDILGVDQKELPDDAIDVTEAYFQLLDQRGPAFSEALSLTGERNRALNQAVILQAALNVLPSLPLRLMITVRTEDSSASRLKEIDFDKLEAGLAASLAHYINLATAANVGARTTFGVSNPPGTFEQ